MKDVNLTLKNAEVKTIVKLLDDEISRLMREDDDDWKRLYSIKGSIIVSIYKHALED